MLILNLLLWSLGMVIAVEYIATSTHEMTRVLEGEDHLLRDLRLYIDAVQHKLNVIRVILNDAEQRLKYIVMDPIGYVANPLNSLPLLRRMHMDAPKLLSYLKLEPGEDLQQISDYRLDVVSELDVEHAAKGLLRIQEIYNLDERHMAKGLLKEKQYNAKLNTLSCVALAQYLRKRGDDQLAKKWLEIALEQYEGTPKRIYELVNYDRTDIQRELGLIHAERDDLLGIGAAFEQVLKYSTKAEHKQEAQAYLRYVNQRQNHLFNCRGQHPLPLSSSKRCRYQTNTTPFLRLAPLKLEQLSIDPHVVIYHDVIYASERSDIIRLSKPYLHRSLVGAARLNHKRTAMNAGLAPNASQHVQRLHRRIEDMAGFDLSTSANLAVLNYGIGGHYDLHNDCSLKQYEDNQDFIDNNRVATVLLYLSDVQLGGLTSFPNLKLAVQPRKGSALVWHNMNNEAECDKRLLHGACPVLLGSRWVATQWIDIAGQWRRKGCLVK